MTNMADSAGRGRRLPVVRNDGNDAVERLMGDPAAKQLLAELDEPAILLALDYRVAAANRAYQARYGRLTGRGAQHCYQISQRLQAGPGAANLATQRRKLSAATRYATPCRLSSA